MVNEIELYSPFEPYIIRSGVHPMGTGYQALLKFDNGYGASVIQGSMFYTSNSSEFEIAVIKFDDDGSWGLVYDTPITDDVIGHLSVGEAIETLEAIKAL
jgi:hypothetical protein